MLGRVRSTRASRGAFVVAIISMTVLAGLNIGGFSHGGSPRSGSGSGAVDPGPSRARTVTPSTSSTNPRVILNVSVGRDPRDVAYDSGRGEVFSANELSANVSVISDSDNEVVATVPVGASPSGVAYDSGTGQVFVANYNSHNVSVISDSDNTVVATVALGTYPGSVVYDVGKGEVFVANFASSNVSVICDGSASCGGANETDRIVATVPVGALPFEMAYDRGRGEVFVTDRSLSPNIQSNVSVISDSTDTTVATVAVGNYAEGVAYDGGKGEVFVANEGSNTTSVISDSTNSVVATLKAGQGPTGVGYDATNGAVFISDEVSDISIISDATDSLVDTVTVGSGPVGVAYDSGRGEVFVANYGVTTVSIIALSSVFMVTFMETGLPSNASWSVTLDGALDLSIVSTITFAEPSGTFNFTVGVVPGYRPSPSSGSVTVSVVDPAPVRLGFASNSSAVGGLSTLDYVLVGVAAAVGAIGVVAILLHRREKAPPTGVSMPSQPTYDAPPTNP